MSIQLLESRGNVRVSIQVSNKEPTGQGLVGTRKAIRESGDRDSAHVTLVVRGQREMVHTEFERVPSVGGDCQDVFIDLQ
jgi:hypothetical protein